MEHRRILHGEAAEGTLEGLLATSPDMRALWDADLRAEQAASGKAGVW